MTSRPTLGRALAWAGIVALALGAWLSWPRARTSGSRTPLHIILVDVSKSVVGPRGSAWSDYARARIAEEARRMEPTGGDLAVVAFGDQLRLLAGPATASEILSRTTIDLLESDTPTGASATRLAGALQLVTTLADGRADARVLILGDGTFTGPDPAPFAAALQRSGIAVEAEWNGVPAQRTNVGIGPLTVPRAIESGAPIVVTFDALLAPAGDAHGTAHVDLVRTDFRGASTTRVDLPLAVSAAAPSIVPLNAQVGIAVAGVITIEARVVLADAAGKPIADAIPEDDASSARLHCEGTLTIGIVDADGAGRRVHDFFGRQVQKDAPRGNFRHGPPPPGMQLVPLKARELASALHALDTVVTVDDPLSDDEARLLASFVREGGGWLDVAGWNWIGRRAREDGPLASIAALTPSRKGLGPRDVILLADASGSMSGAPFESVRAALPALLDAALPEDDVEVRFFADDVSVPIRIAAREREDAQRRRAFLDLAAHAREPRGATKMWRALEELAGERAGSPRDALVILLGDGRDPENENARERGPALRARLGASRVRLAVVAAGNDPDRTVLESLLLPGETVATAGDLSAPGASARLAQGFARDIARDAVRMGPPAIDVVPLASGAGLAAEIGLAAGAPPPIARAVRTEVTRRDGANVPGVFFAAPDGEPLGAIVREGLGLVASLAFQPDSDWAPAWVDAAPLMPLVRALARDHALRGAATMQVRLEEESERLCLENAPPDFEAPARAQVRDAAGNTAQVVFGDADAGGDPLARRCARLPAELERAGGFWTVRFERPGGVTLELPVPTPRAAEFVLAPRRFQPARTDAAERAATPAPASHPLAPWTLACGSVLLFAAALLGAFSGAFSRLRAA